MQVWTAGGCHSCSRLNKYKGLVVMGYGKTTLACLVYVLYFAIEDVEVVTQYLVVLDVLLGSSLLKLCAELTLVGNSYCLPQTTLKFVGMFTFLL